MDKDAIGTLIPAVVIIFGFDLISGFPMLHLIGSFLSQNGF